MYRFSPLLLKFFLTLKYFCLFVEQIKIIFNFQYTYSLCILENVIIYCFFSILLITRFNKLVLQLW